MSDYRLSVLVAYLEPYFKELEGPENIKQVLEGAMARAIDNNHYAASAPAVIGAVCELTRLWLVDVDRVEESERLNFETRYLFALQRMMVTGNMRPLKEMEDEFDAHKDDKYGPYDIHDTWVKVCADKNRRPEDLRYL